jgi:hypothetical protein
VRQRQEIQKLLRPNRLACKQLAGLDCEPLRVRKKERPLGRADLRAARDEDGRLGDPARPFGGVGGHVQILADLSLRWKLVAGMVHVDYISSRNTGDPGLEDVCGPLI